MHQPYIYGVTFELAIVTSHLPSSPIDAHIRHFHFFIISGPISFFISFKILCHPFAIYTKKWLKRSVIKRRWIRKKAYKFWLSSSTEYDKHLVNRGDGGNDKLMIPESPQSNWEYCELTTDDCQWHLTNECSRIKTRIRYITTRIGDKI